jgi:arabinose-5-phosphate isomerase
MRSGDDVPKVLASASFNDLMRQMSAKSVGASAIVDTLDQVVGIFTDGDLRRLIEKGVDLRNLVATDVMHRTPRTVKATELAVATAELMVLYSITSVLVTDADNKLCGIVHIGDLMRAKVI